MKANGSIYVAAVLALLVGYFSYQWWFNQNRVVKRQLGELASTLSAPAEEADLDRVARLARLRRYLTDDVRVISGRSGPELGSRDAVVAAAAGWKPVGGGNVDFIDVDVKIDADTARAYATAEVTTRNPATGEQTLDTRETAFSIVKREGTWLVSAAEVRDVATDPPPPSRP